MYVKHSLTRRFVWKQPPAASHWNVASSNSPPQHFMVFPIRMITCSHHTTPQRLGEKKIEMETGDITLLQLRQYGVDVDPLLGIAALTAELLYPMLLQSLERMSVLTKQEIRKQFPSKLPGAKSARFSICESLTKYLSGAGYSASSYDALMYPTESTTKPLLNWLVAELGRAAESATEKMGEVQDDERSATATALQKGVMALHTLVNDAERVTSAKGAKAAGGRALLLPRAAHRKVPATARTPFFAATAIAWAEETSLISQIEETHAALSKVPLLPSEQALRPSAARTVLDSVLEAASAAWAHDKAAADWLASAKLLSRPVQEGTITRRAKRVDRQGEASQQGGMSIDAMFLNTSEDGLDGDGSRALAARRAREAAAEAEVNAAVESLTEKHRSAQERVAQRELEVTDIKSRLSALKKQVRGKKELLAELQTRLDQTQAELAQIKSDFAEQEAEAHARRSVAAEKEQLLALMDDPDGSEAKIRQQIAEATQRRNGMQVDLEAKLLKIEQKRDQLLEQGSAAGADREERLAELRRELKQTKQQIKEKSKEIKQLRYDFERCPKDIDRSQFVRLIFDMTTNIRKQQGQIDKVKKEIFDANADIDKMQSALRELFSRLESRVYASAVSGKGGAPSSSGKGGDDFAKQAFKQIVDVRAAYSSLVALIEQRGEVKHELHGIEEKASKLARLVEGYNIQQVREDLEAVEEENGALTEKIEGAQQTEAADDE